MILTCPITSQGFLTAAFQCFANEMCLQMTFGDQNGLLMEESAQVLGDILHNGLVNVDQGEDQTGLPGVFSAFVNIPAPSPAAGPPGADEDLCGFESAKID